MAKKVLLLAREFNRGEFISDYCWTLARSLLTAGYEPHIVAFGERDELIEGVYIHRTTFMLNGDNFFTWAMLMNNELKRRGRELLETGEFVLIHGNDWVTAPAAMALAKWSELPLVMTMHSLEKERGFNAPHSGLIDDLEWWSGYESNSIIVANERTKDLLVREFGLPPAKVVQTDVTGVLDVYRGLI